MLPAGPAAGGGAVVIADRKQRGKSTQQRILVRVAVVVDQHDRPQRLHQLDPGRLVEGGFHHAGEPHKVGRPGLRDLAGPGKALGGLGRQGEHRGEQVAHRARLGRVIGAVGARRLDKKGRNGQIQ